MNTNNLLKLNWERRHAHFHIDDNLAQKLITKFTDEKISNYLLLSTGCANTNYKIEFDNGERYILRIYIREKDAFYRETALHALLKGKLPVPEVIYTNDACDIIPHPFAIMEYIDGQLMRDVILESNQQDIDDCAYSAGLNLQQLRDISFKQAGFFNSKLEVIPFSEQENYLTFIQSCLENDTVQSAIGTKLTKQLAAFTQQNAAYFPSQNKGNLTHADYDPSNLLVKKINDHHQIVAILDWEFAFSGTYLFDIGLFLRYSHKLPSVYEQKFIEGIVAEGNPLPENWKRSAKLLDILSLLSVLKEKTDMDRPNLHKDITLLLKNTINSWDLYP